MEITLNHTIVPSFNNVESAEFYARIFGFKFVKEWGYFAVVKVNQSLSLDFVTKKEFSSLHYAFKVNDVQFDEILQSIKNENVPFGSAPSSVDDGKINHNYGGRGVYFTDINGHVLEIITKDYVLE
jgi:catechol 2,3-dioxygenase-like lactoylglutathione lyase family enzyme